jgi:hypothetical protein
LMPTQTAEPRAQGLRVPTLGFATICEVISMAAHNPRRTGASAASCWLLQKMTHLAGREVT